MIIFSAVCGYLLIGYVVLGRIEGPNSRFIWRSPPRTRERALVVTLWPVVTICLLTSGRF